MARVGAKSHYFFKKEYFFAMMESREFKTDLLLAIDNESGIIISGALFVQTHGIVQYHLSGSHEGFTSLHPIKLLIDEMRIRASREKNVFFNLGGGLGNQEDSLFDFKAGFSRDFRPFKVWKYIVDNSVYQQLVSSMHEDDNGDHREDYGSFFPGYRFMK
jgi:lipid II:glycine glycyltransferase (peptidoglycan interpeptide bridge formation enzyme)